jgi:hypothetical protein
MEQKVKPSPRLAPLPVGHAPEPIAAGEKYLASYGWKIGKHARK